MPYRDTSPGWQASSGPYANLDVPYDRLEDTTPTIHYPAAVLDGAAAGAGTQMTGTIVSVDANRSIAKINVARDFEAYHQLRNVLTYAAALEATWSTINVGTPVYYDRSATMPANVYLSLSPLDNLGVANPLFGYVVWAQDEIADGFGPNEDPYPTGSAVAGVTHTDIVIRQA